MTEGIITEKKIGNINLWFVHEGTEQLQFPDDYFQVQEKYLDYLLKCSESAVYNLIRNCLNSEVNVTKLITEVVLPAIPQIQKNFDEGKIGIVELRLMTAIISKCLIGMKHNTCHVTIKLFLQFCELVNDFNVCNNF